MNLTEHDLVFQGVTIVGSTTDVTTQWVDFIGTYSPVVIYEDGTEKHNLYLSESNTLYYPTSTDFTVKSCRAYFALKNGLTAGEPSSSTPGEATVCAFTLNFGEEEATGIVSVSADSKGYKDNSGWYSLDGMRLSSKPVAKGLYIYNGRKVAIE